MQKKLKNRENRVKIEKDYTQKNKIIDPMKKATMVMVLHWN